MPISMLQGSSESRGGRNDGIHSQNAAVQKLASATRLSKPSAKAQRCGTARC
jgi:hypothetical protein